MENAKVPSKRKDMIKRLTSPSCHDKSSQLREVQQGLQVFL